MSYRFLPIIPVLLACAACAGGGTGATTTTPAAMAVQLGLRGLPDHEVTVSAETPPQPGQETTFAIRVEPVPQAVSVWLGGAYEPDAVATPVSAGEDGIYRIRLTVPATSDQGLFVRLVDTMGNIAESGSMDFRLP